MSKTLVGVSGLGVRNKAGRLFRRECRDSGRDAGDKTGRESDSVGIDQYRVCRNLD